MRPGAIALAVVPLLLASAEAWAIDTYSTSQFRKIIAQATVPDRNDEQLYFRVLAGTFWTNEIHRRTSSDGVYYQFSGTVYLTAEGKTRTLASGLNHSHQVTVAASRTVAVKLVASLS